MVQRLVVGLACLVVAVTAAAEEKPHTDIQSIKVKMSVSCEALFKNGTTRNHPVPAENDVSLTDIADKAVELGKRCLEEVEKPRAATDIVTYLVRQRGGRLEMPTNVRVRYGGAGAQGSTKEAALKAFSQDAHKRLEKTLEIVKQEYAFEGSHGR